MADSIRQDIIDALDARLKAIKVSGGYKTNAGLHVFDWLDRDLADTELDAIIYRDRTDDLTPLSTRKFENRVTVEIEAKTKQASGTARRLREIIEDIYKAIGTDETFGGLARSTRPEREEIEIQQQDKISGAATLSISIVYETTKWGF